MKALTLTFIPSRKKLVFDIAKVFNAGYGNEWINSDHEVFGMVEVSTDKGSFIATVRDEGPWKKIPIFRFEHLNGSFMWCIVYDDDDFNAEEAKEKLLAKARQLEERLKEALGEIQE